MFVEGSQLLSTLIVEDNNRSVDTNIADQRGPNWKRPLSGLSCVKTCHYTRVWLHAVAGLKTMVEFKNPNPR